MNAAERLGAPAWLNFLLGGKFWLLYAGILFYIYGGMFGLAFALEGGRTLPIWSGQYRSFIPGDFFLGLVLAAGLVLAKQLADIGESGWWQTKSWHIGVAVMALILATTLFMVQASPEEKADKGLFFSSTRIWHQLLIWGPGLYVAFAIVLPALIWAVKGQGVDNVYTLVCVVGFLFWTGFMVYDGMFPPEINPERPLHDRVDVSWLLRFARFIRG